MTKSCLIAASTSPGSRGTTLKSIHPPLRPSANRLPSSNHPPFSTKYLFLLSTALTSTSAAWALLGRLSSPLSNRQSSRSASERPSRRRRAIPRYRNTRARHVQRLRSRPISIHSSTTISLQFFSIATILSREGSNRTSSVSLPTIWVNDSWPGLYSTFGSATHLSSRVHPST